MEYYIVGFIVHMACLGIACLETACLSYNIVVAYFFFKSQIFKTTTEFEFERLLGRMDELAYLNAGVSIVMADAR